MSDDVRPRRRLRVGALAAALTAALTLLCCTGGAGPSSSPNWVAKGPTS